MKKISIAILTLLVVLSACKKVPEVNLKYVDVERDLITVGTTTATVQCDYEYIATLKKAYLYYGEGQDEADMNAAEMRVVQNTLYVDLAGLRENTTYSYYYEFHNGFNSMRTVMKTFKTGSSPAAVTLPTVVTVSVTEITNNSAKGGGEVTNDGGAEVTERGICWSTNANPTLNDNHVAAGTGTGAFTAKMNGLEVGSAYHVRAYATNEKGTAYGLDREFVTVGGGGSVDHEGALSGMFSVAPDRWVRFSKGNLQYQASTNTWRFAENQWDFVGGYHEYTASEYGNVFENGIKCTNDSVSEFYNGWIDLFAYGTSGWNSGANCYQPWNTEWDYHNYLLGGDPENQMIDDYSQADWGIYNSVSNGGNTPNIWRTLTCQEWSYMLHGRTEADRKAALGMVNGFQGLILLPDRFTCPAECSFVFGCENGFETNMYSLDEWRKMELEGAAFLPFSGWRFRSYIYGPTMEGNHFSHYWLSTRGNVGTTEVSTISFGFFPSGGYKIQYSNTYDRGLGCSVRLVQDDTPQPSIQIPTVISSDVSSVTSHSAVCGGEVTDDGGATVIERGICWSTFANPTISDSHVSAGTGTGLFSATMSGLQASTTYHVRAYAINSAGTAYGLDKEFVTIGGGGSGTPEGAINGLFTINANGDQVYFSQGNLQYQASTNTWRFAEHQWERLKEENTNVSPTYEGWIDLFNWGTSGYTHGANCYQPWSTSTNETDYYAYGIETCNLYDQTGKADWGYNPISNGGNQENLWRTLTYEEWRYLLFDRETPSGIRFVKASVNNINGAILLPHHWNDSIYLLNNPNDGGAYYEDNLVSTEDWVNILQEAGAVFLPNGANRIGTSLAYDANGDYWTSTRKMDGDFAYDICIQANSIGYSAGNGNLAQSVRLVQDAH